MTQINPDVNKALQDYQAISDMIKSGKKVDPETIKNFEGDISNLLDNGTVPESIKNDLAGVMKTLVTPDGKIDAGSMFRVGLDLQKIAQSGSGWPPGSTVDDAIKNLEYVVGKAPPLDISQVFAARAQLQDALNNPLLSNEQKEKIKGALGELDKIKPEEGVPGALEHIKAALGDLE